MIEITGKVTVERSGSPVSGVIVEAFDLSRGAAPDSGLLANKDASWVTAQPSLGSDHAAKDGSFSIRVDRDGSAGPVRLALAVLAPDRPSSQRSYDVIHLVRRVRLVDQGVQRYLIAVSADALRRIPSAVARRSMSPSTATAAAALADERARVTADVKKGVAKVRRREGDRLRPVWLRHEKEVSDALMERRFRPLRDTKGALPDAVVRPTETARARSRLLLDAVLRNDVPSITARGLVDVESIDAARLLDANGVPVQNVTSSDVERLLFGPTHVDGLPARYRRDIVAVGCRNRAFPVPQTGAGVSPVGGSAGNGAGDGNGGNGGAPNTGQATMTQVKRALARLLAETEAVGLPLGVVGQRATPEEIGENLRTLLLREGPAEAVARFDFERLFLASNLPIGRQPDKRLVHEFTHSVQALNELGGDLNAHRGRGLDVLDALEAEVTLLASSNPLAPPGTVSGSVATQDPVLTLKSLGGWGLGGIGEIVDAVSDAVADIQTAGRYVDLQSFLAKIRQLRGADYDFTPFGVDAAGGAATYGLLLTYTQQWRPRGHQAGELVKTVPLAPKSSVKYRVRRKTGRSYTDKRAEASESTYSSESQDVRRDIEKIVRNAKIGTSFSLTNEAGGGVPGVGSSSTTSVFTRNAERASESTKEAFREETRKHAEQLKQSSSTEVTVTSTEEVEVEETISIENPNDELTVTYMLYELQRRFEVSERLASVKPVVLVAQPLPDPTTIDEAWVIRYDWIIRRVLLDPSFLPAVDYVTLGKLIADFRKAEELEANLERQAELVHVLQHQLEVLRSPMLLPDPRNFIEAWKVSIYNDKYGPEWREDEERIREVFGDDAADRMAERRRSLEQVESELKREVGQLQRATDAYNAAFVQYATEAIQVERFLLHLRDNIVYYVQALLDHEGRDQQFLRLREQQVPEIVGGVSYKLVQTQRPPRPPEFRPPLGVEATASLSLGGDVPLGDVADLASPLGYVGNALVFPVRKWNPLVTFMLVPFSNAATGVTDPDDRGNVTIAELAELIRCLHDHLKPQDFATLRPAIEEAWAARISDPRADSVEITLPTGSLFMEALPGTHPLLEDFKLLHRALDVQLVAGDVVSKRLEQLRLAARLVRDVLDDPDTEKIIVRDGVPTVIDTG